MIIGDLVKSIVEPLVTYPELVNVTEITEDSVVTVEIRVAPDDMGRVIGKGGRVINSIRTVAKALATKKKVKVFVEVV